MPIDDLTILGNMLRAARKEKKFHAAATGR